MRLLQYNNPINEFNSVIDELFNHDVFSRISAPISRFQENSLKLDTYKDINAYHIIAELPGVKKEEINISLEKNTLKIEGERQFKEGEEISKVFHFSRSIQVGDDIDREGIQAKLEDGLLTLTLPKTEERKPQNIEIS